MEIRKIQMTGGSSYIVTLPKNWILANNLKKNDSVNISEEGDGSLSIVSSAVSSEESHTTKRIVVDDGMDGDYIFRLLLGAYMSGYSVIDVYSANVISSENVDVVERFVQASIGLEILEGSDDNIVIKDLMDPSEMKLSRGLERMRSLVRNMLSDTFLGVRDGDIHRFEAVIDRDREVDRLEWMIARQTNMCQNDISIAKKMGHTQVEVTRYYTLCRIVERIGDHAVVLSKNCRRLVEDGLMTGEMKDDLLMLGEKITSSFTKSLGMFDSHSTEDANGCIEEIHDSIEACKQFNRFNVTVPVGSVIGVSLIAGSLRRVNEYSIDISELAINAMMGASLKS